MFIVTIVLVFALLVLMFVVNFVLTNIEMFQTPFDIVFSVPLLKWSHTWEGIEFMYIIAGSVLLGALVIALSTWVLDTKRKIKLRSMRKELKRLDQELQEIKTSFSKEEEAVEDVSTAGEEAPEFPDSSSATPEEITKSFEDSVKDSDFLKESQEDFDEEPITKPDLEEENVISEEDKQLLQETPIEAELVDSEELSTEEKVKQKEDKGLVNRE